MTAASPDVRPAAVDLAELDAVSRLAIGHWTQACGALDAYALARESLGAWTCACTAWTDYLSRLATSADPLAVMDAGTRLMADGLEICTRAAAARLAAGGVKTPLLNDA